MDILTNKLTIEQTRFKAFLPLNNSLCNSLEAPLSNEQQRALRNIIEKGLPNIAAPYQKIAEEINVSEQQVITQIKNWQQSGLIKRFGLVIKHRQLGFNANAMVVWNIPDALIPQVAEQLASFNEVSLCYKRPRRLPDWPYNLFCMIHGTDKNIVLAQINKISEQILNLNPTLKNIEKDILFSTKAYKQHGARYNNTKRDVALMDNTHG